MYLDPKYKNFFEAKRTLEYLETPPAKRKLYTTDFYAIAPLLKLNQMAPEFTSTDLSGRKVSLKQLRGKYVLLNFWATWCPPCVQELPLFCKLRVDYHEDQLEMISISSDRSKADCEKGIKKYGLNWTNVFNDVELIKKYEISDGIPMTFLIDKDGKLVYMFVGGLSNTDEIRKLMMNPKTNTVRESQQANDINLKLQTKNEITFSGSLSKDYRIYYLQEYEGSKDVELGKESTKKILIPTKSSIFTYTFPERFFPIYIEFFPGDDINFSFDQNGKIKYSSKNNPERSTELSFYYKNVLFSGKYDFSLPLLKQRTLVQNIQYFDSVELARKEYFNDFASSNKVSKHFISLITQLIKEKKNKSLASILVNTKESNLQMFVPVIDSLKKFYLNNDIPYSIERSEGLYQFGSFLTIKEMNLKDTPENRFKMAIKYFTGRNLDATMFWIVRKALNANDPSAQNFLKEFYAHCKNPEIVEKLKVEETKYIFASDMSTTDGLILLDNTKTTWAQQLANNKGKVIYVDFWASWCGPCITEMPSLEKLKKQFANKGVVFLSISTDDQFAAWKTKVDQLNMNSPNSFLLANNKTSQLMKSLDIKTIPRFVLIDKKGKIVSKDALRPGDKKITTLIDQFL